MYSALMISLIFKALFLYILFLMIRGAWRGYKVYGAMQDALRGGETPHGDIFGRAQRDSDTGSSREQTRKSNSSDIIEAEYRVIDPKN